MSIARAIEPGVRIRLHLTAPDEEVDYGRVTELVHAMDGIVIAEIENWQAVLGGKNMNIPV